MSRLQKLIDRINKDSREADRLAKEEFGPDAALFLEAGGSLYVMNSAADGSIQERQKHIVMIGRGGNSIGHGCW